VWCAYIVLWLNAGMAADPLLHVVVKLQGTEELLCYVKHAALAAQVFKTCKLKAKCQEGTLQDANGMDIVEDGSELSAGTYFFTPAEPIGMSPLSTSNCPVGFRQAHNKRQIDKLASSFTASSMASGIAVDFLCISSLPASWRCF